MVKVSRLIANEWKMRDLKVESRANESRREKAVRKQLTCSTNERTKEESRRRYETNFEAVNGVACANARSLLRKSIGAPELDTLGRKSTYKKSPVIQRERARSRQAARENERSAPRFRHLHTRVASLVSGMAGVRQIG